MFFVVSMVLGGSVVYSAFDRTLGVMFASNAAIELACILVWFVLADGLAGTLLFPNGEGDITWVAHHSHGIVVSTLPVVAVLVAGAAARAAIDGEAGMAAFIAIGAAAATAVNVLIFGWLVKDGVGYSAASGEYVDVAPSVRSQWALTSGPGPALGRELRQAVLHAMFSGQAIAGSAVAVIAAPACLTLASRLSVRSH